MHALPEGAPATLNEAFALVNAATNPGVFELKLMVLAEAAGQALYGAMAEDAPNDEVKALLLANGREEMAHAHRVSRAIGAITGEDYPVPSAEENPYLTAPMKRRPVTAATLAGLAQSEFAGDSLYTGSQSAAAVAVVKNPSVLTYTGVLTSSPSKPATRASW